MTTSPVAPIVTLTQALQSLTEAVEALSDSVPAHNRPAFDATLKRVRQARSEVQLWVEETR